MWHGVTVDRTGQPFTKEEVNDLRIRMLCCLVVSAMPSEALSEIQSFLIDTWDFYRQIPVAMTPSTSIVNSKAAKSKVAERPSFHFEEG